MWINYIDKARHRITVRESKVTKKIVLLESKAIQKEGSVDIKKEILSKTKSGIIKKPKYQKKGQPYCYCCFVGCKKTNHDNVSFRRITSLPKYVPSTKDMI